MSGCASIGVLFVLGVTDAAGTVGIVDIVGVSSKLVGGGLGGVILLVSRVGNG